MSLITKKAKERKGLTERYWSPLDFEEVANSIDHEDNDLSGDNDENLKEYRKLGRPYLISAGLEGGVKFTFTMSPLTATVAANSQTDITYDNSKDYRVNLPIIAASFTPPLCCTATMHYCTQIRSMRNSGTGPRVRLKPVSTLSRAQTPPSSREEKESSVTSRNA